MDMRDSRGDLSKGGGQIENVASDLLQGQSYQVKTVLDHYARDIMTFLEFKDSPGNPLGCSPIDYSTVLEGEEL